MTLRSGSRLGPYEVVVLIGAGGMGEVYRAQDERIGREVAVKVLPPAFASDPDRLRRFEQEARAAGQLDHPNILAVHDVGTFEGAPYIVTELLEGKTLRERLKGKGLTVRKAVEAAIQVASGLAAAHQKGIVHRDIKPENVFITNDGHVKILDFGIAKLAAARGLEESRNATTVTEATRTGAVLGTVGYMSPEQVRGQAVDHRSDIFSLGCVLHEMFSGRSPFRRDTAADTAGAILQDEPAPLPGAVPPGLKRIIHRCLEKRSEDRFQSSRDLEFALQEEAEALAVSPAHRPMPRPRRWLWIGAATLVALGATLALYLLVVRGRSAAPAKTGQIRSLAVLPLANLSGDPAQEYFSDGMTEELITSLSKISALKVISRTSVMQFKGTKKPIREIAQALGVDGIVEGSVLRAGDRVRITAQLINAATDTHLWAESYARDMRDVLALQGEVARAVAGEIKAALTPQEEARLASAKPVNPEAYDAYLKGLHHWYVLTPADLDTAQRYFELALAKDPNYALAYAGVTLVWAARQQMGFTPPAEAAPKAKAAAVKAVALDDAVAEAYYALAIVKAWSDWDWAGAEPEFKRAIELNPSYPDARAYYSHYLTNMQRPGEAMPQMERALELDPFNALFQSLYACDLLYVRRYDDAIAQARRVLRTAPDHLVANTVLWYAYEAKGMDTEALTGAKAFYNSVYRVREVAEALDRGSVEGGYRAAMRHAADALAAHARTAFVLPTDVAGLYLSGGDKDRALAWLEKGIAARDPALPYLGLPFYDNLRSDPRFQSLLRRIGLPAAAKK